MSRRLAEQVYKSLSVKGEEDQGVVGNGAGLFAVDDLDVFSLIVKGW